MTEVSELLPPLQGDGSVPQLPLDCEPEACTPMSTSVISPTPQLSRARAPACTSTLRRSGRIAGLPGAQNAAEHALLPPVPCDGTAYQTPLELLEAEVCIPLSTPVICPRPQLRRARTPVSTTTLRRSGRIAALPRAENATKQAQNTLLKKLGMEVEENATDAQVAAKFRTAFGGDISERKKHTMQILLNGKFDLSSMDLELTGLDGDVA